MPAHQGVRRNRGRSGRAYFTRAMPGETRPRRCSLAVMRVRSASVEAAASRLRNWLTFSLRVRRRRISGRRLGADTKEAPVPATVLWGQSGGQQKAPTARANYSRYVRYAPQGLGGSGRFEPSVRGLASGRVSITRILDSFHRNFSWPVRLVGLTGFSSLL